MNDCPRQNPAYRPTPSNSGLGSLRHEPSWFERPSLALAVKATPTSIGNPPVPNFIVQTATLGQLTTRVVPRSLSSIRGPALLVSGVVHPDAVKHPQAMSRFVVTGGGGTSDGRTRAANWPSVLVPAQAPITGRLDDARRHRCRNGSPARPLSREGRCQSEPHHAQKPQNVAEEGSTRP